MTRLALAVAAVLPALAQAQTAPQVCPTAADLAAGVVVTYAHGGIDTFTADPLTPGAVVWQGELQGISLGTTTFAQGYIYLSATGPNGQEVRYDYGLLPADLPRPEPGGSWEVVATVTADGVASTERQIHTFGRPGSLTLGACTWEIIPITIAYPEYSEDLLWFPGLGLSVRAGDTVNAITPLALMP